MHTWDGLYKTIQYRGTTQIAAENRQPLGALNAGGTGRGY